VLARTQRLLEERGEDACAHELALCDLFVVEAGRRFRASRIALQSAQDELRRTVARDVRARRGYGVTDALLRDAAGGAAEESPITTEAAR
jgi:acyl-CoA dehydrogenase family protein 9